MSKKIQHLVVDTTAFIKAVNLQDIAENVYTVHEVVDEITNDRQRKKLVILPYDLKIKDVFSENVKHISEFSKKTGDYTSLSATDLKVMALTYQLEKEYVGVGHLKTEPTMQKNIRVSGINNFELHPEEVKKVSEHSGNSIGCTSTSVANTSNDSNETEEVKKVSEHSGNSIGCTSTSVANTSNDSNETVKIDGQGDTETAETIADQIKHLDLADEQVTYQIITKIDSEEEDSDTDSDSDGGEWITPGNLADKKKEQENGEFEDKSVDVACITSDFAMQNVLKQIGLNVTTVDGRIIKQLRTFIFRCTTCFKTTSIMTKLFCPKCGHATLKKVGVSIDDAGNQHIHINGRKPLNAKGKRFSLPTPRGGQHFQYPILTEDQHIHKRFASKAARSKTNALDPDYIAGFSPFAVKDVTSKSAVLGVRANKQDLKYWMKHHSKGKK